MASSMEGQNVTVLVIITANVTINHANIFCLNVCIKTDICRVTTGFPPVKRSLVFH